jgi:Asp-tRNA(Asn)/Glu-tRNA(Gln) amidotransferase A subunit family amidase
MTDKYQTMTALQLGAAIGEGEIDPVDLTEYFLTRIEQLDPDNIVFITVTAERARSEARAAQERAHSGMRLGPLDGVPVSWKDLVDSAGIATTGASELFRDRVPTRDALILARATRAGMVCLGKTNLSEFAFSGLGINPAYGTPVNPYDIEPPAPPSRSPAAWPRLRLVPIPGAACAFRQRGITSSASRPPPVWCRCRACCRCRGNMIPPAPWPRTWPMPVPCSPCCVPRSPPI